MGGFVKMFVQARACVIIQSTILATAHHTCQHKKV